MFNFQAPPTTARQIVVSDSGSVKWRMPGDVYRQALGAIEKTENADQEPSGSVVVFLTAKAAANHCDRVIEIKVTSSCCILLALCLWFLPQKES